MKPTRLILTVLFALIPGAALAHGSEDAPLHVDPSLKDCSVQFAPGLTQSAFARFVREFGSISAYKLLAAPVPLGRGHFTVGVEQTSFTVEEHSNAWNDTFAHPAADHWLGSNQNFPKIRARAGVADRVDVGAFYARNPDANYGWAGVDVTYAVLQQSVSMPVSLGVRGAYTKTLYVHDMDMHAATLDVAAGRTFWGAVTPYVGFGTDGVYARETSDAVNLDDEWQSDGHVQGGVEVRWWHVAIAGEAYRGALTSYQVQVAARF